MAVPSGRWTVHSALPASGPDSGVPHSGTPTSSRRNSSTVIACAEAGMTDAASAATTRVTREKRAACIGQSSSGLRPREQHTVGRRPLLEERPPDRVTLITLMAAHGPAVYGRP